MIVTFAMFLVFTINWDREEYTGRTSSGVRVLFSLDQSGALLNPPSCYSMWCTKYTKNTLLRNVQCIYLTVYRV